jgi:Uma2 family endonuclease
MATTEEHRLTVEAYLELEAGSEVRHEYVDGELFAMTGASCAHSFLIGSLYVRLWQHARRGPCQVHTSSVRVHVAAANAFYYPDIVVSCDERDRSDSHSLEYPGLMVEVLSPSTAGFDHGKKFSDYRTLDSLHDYVLVHRDRRLVEHFRRQRDGTWLLTDLRAEDTLVVEALAFEVRVDELYEDVDLP